MRRRFLPLAAAFSMMAAAASDEDQNGSAREASAQTSGERYVPEGSEGLTSVPASPAAAQSSDTSGATPQDQATAA